MSEAELQDIWRKNLAYWAGTLTLDSIIIRAMQEVQEKVKLTNKTK